MRKTVIFRRSPNSFVDIEEKDGHIFSEMSKRKRAVIGLDWNIVPPPNSSESERKLAEEVDGWLNQMTDLEDMMFDLWTRSDTASPAWKSNGKTLVRYGCPRHSIIVRRAWFKVNAMDEVLLRKDGNPDGEKLWDLGWIVHKHRSRSGILARSGLMRTLVWPYLFKNYSVRDLAEFLEIYGLPHPNRQICLRCGRQR